MPMSSRLLRPRATGFNPKSISGLQLWLDAADASSLTLNGSTVSAWRDKSGNNRHASQATANNQPTYITGSLNSRNAVSFDGINDTLLTSNFTVPQPHTMLLVGKRSGTANQNFTDGGSLGRAAVYWASTDNWGMFAGVGLVGPTGTDTGWHIFCATFNTTSSTLRLDGATIAAGNAGTESFTGLRISGFNASTAILNGSIAEVLSYSGALSQTNRSILESYLSKKWGVSVA